MRRCGLKPQRHQENESENFEKLGNSVSSVHYLLVKSSKKGVFIANRKPSYYKRCQMYPQQKAQNGYLTYIR